MKYRANYDYFQEQRLIRVNYCIICIGRRQRFQKIYRIGLVCRNEVTHIYYGFISSFAKFQQSHFEISIKKSRNRTFYADIFGRNFSFSLRNFPPTFGNLEVRKLPNVGKKHVIKI